MALERARLGIGSRAEIEEIEMTRPCSLLRRCGRAAWNQRDDRTKQKIDGSLY
jgi:hypothetical protein